MDFAWLPAQQELYEHVLAYARDTWGDALAEATWTRADWARLGEFGLLGLCIPVEYGGMGLDALTTARCMEALGQGCRDMGLVFSAGAHLFAGCMPLVEHGSEALKRELLPALADGRRVAANAITEAEAGSDVFALRTTAELDGDHYVLNGAKSYVTNGPVADLFLVYTTEDPSHGFMGVSAFAVDRDTPGLRVGAPFETAGLRSSPISPVYLEDCRVPASRMVGGPGRGASVFTGSMLWERSCLFAAYLGAMERQVEATMRHAKERHQFQRPLSKHQAVSHRIVDMVHRLESARLLLYRGVLAARPRTSLGHECVVGQARGE